MGAEPVVSIVMPLYNKRPYVKRAIDSIRSQTFTNSGTYRRRRRLYGWFCRGDARGRSPDAAFSPRTRGRAQHATGALKWLQVSS